MTRPDKVIPEICRDYIVSSRRKSHTAMDAILYALSVGVSTDPQDREDLKFTYENSDGFSALPTYATVVPVVHEILAGIHSCPGIPEFNTMMLLHGEEQITWNGPIPTEATFECVTRITDVLDKTKGALVMCVFEMYEVDQSTNQRVLGRPLCVINMNLFIRGLGGFGGKASQSSDEKPKKSQIVEVNGKAQSSDVNGKAKKTDAAEPDLVIKRSTTPNQAILYRLTGDINPLHIDPDLASSVGFKQPVLHGLCSFGFAAHIIVKHLGENDAACLGSMEGRFSSPVFPGNELEIKIWVESEKEVRFSVSNVTTGAVCISDGKATLNKAIKIKKCEETKESAL